jgi:hypothetical protein
VHCGQTFAAHHASGQCYTTDELVARLRFAQCEGRWPGPDEGCNDVDTLVEGPGSVADVSRTLERTSSHPEDRSRLPGATGEETSHV